MILKILSQQEITTRKTHGRIARTNRQINVTKKTKVQKKVQEKKREKIVYTSRFVRVILSRGPC